jgi:ATP-dependent DNA helicase RecQ
VIHYQTPGSVVAYYQQVGRAGRALDAAYGVLLSGEEETDITNYFIESAFPTREEVQQVLDALQAPPRGLSKPEILSRVNISNGRIDKTIALLSLESPAPIVKQDTKWRLTAANLSEAFWQRAERLTALRLEEQRQMQEYVSLTSGHMAFLIRALDGDPGMITPPPLPPLTATADPALVREAVTFLRGANLSFEPRLQWPSGGMPQYKVRGHIPPGQQAQPGRALCIWRDAGWGNLVRQGKYDAGYFADELVDACSALVRGWNPSPSPTWVTCIPSRRHPNLVPDFARRLATALDLPFHEVLEKTDDRQPQKAMANSVQQALNMDGSLAVKVRPLPRGPVLLVDDMVDSRWTLTVATWLLRSNGSAEVYPLVLALTGHEK